jgi:hypothetical protein
MAAGFFPLHRAPCAVNSFLDFRHLPHHVCASLCVSAAKKVFNRRRKPTFARRTWPAKTSKPSGQQRKIIRQNLQDCAGSLFLPESAYEKHVNPV